MAAHVLLAFVRRLLPLFLAATALLFGAFVPAAASARQAPSPIRFGIGDQHPQMFSDARWQDLDLEITRYNVPWNAADDPAQLQRAIAFVEAARGAGVETLMHLTGRMVDHRAEPLPSRLAYRRAVRKLVAIFRPMGVTTWGVWNEENHPTQSTFGRPDRAAQFFLEMRAACVGCKIVALDLLTLGTPNSVGIASYRGYLKGFYKALGSKRKLATLIGIHTYGELIVNKGPTLSRDLTRFARRYVPKSRFWITETGGIAANHSRSCSEARQLTGTRRMFTQTAQLAKERVDRLYMYNWTASDCTDMHDSGLIRIDGTARPAYKAVVQGASAFSR
jgi:hypothetical protein